MSLNCCDQDYFRSAVWWKFPFKIKVPHVTLLLQATSWTSTGFQLKCQHWNNKLTFILMRQTYNHKHTYIIINLTSAIDIESGTCSDMLGGRYSNQKKGTQCQNKFWQSWSISRMTRGHITGTQVCMGENNPQCVTPLVPSLLCVLTGLMSSVQQRVTLSLRVALTLLGSPSHAPQSSDAGVRTSGRKEVTSPPLMLRVRGEGGAAAWWREEHWAEEEEEAGGGGARERCGACRGEILTRTQINAPSDIKTHCGTWWQREKLVFFNTDEWRKCLQQKGHFTHPGQRGGAWAPLGLYLCTACIE